MSYVDQIVVSNTDKANSEYAVHLMKKYLTDVAENLGVVARIRFWP